MCVKSARELWEIPWHFPPLRWHSLLVIVVTSYDIHRSIKGNDQPPTERQVAALVTQVDKSRHPVRHIEKKHNLHISDWEEKEK